MLTAKAENAGREVISVNLGNTSCTCLEFRLARKGTGPHKPSSPAFSTASLGTLTSSVRSTSCGQELPLVRPPTRSTQKKPRPYWRGGSGVWPTLGGTRPDVVGAHGDRQLWHGHAVCGPWPDRRRRRAVPGSRSAPRAAPTGPAPHRGDAGLSRARNQVPWSDPIGPRPECRDIRPPRQPVTPRSSPATT